MNNTEIYERIERYLEDNMEAAEKQSFETELLSNTYLAQEVDDMRQLRSQLTHYRERTLLREQLEEFHQEVKGSSKMVGFRRYLQPLAIAASVLLVGSLGFLFYSHRYGLQKAEYKELKREIAQLKTSQKKIVSTLQNESKAKPAIPSKFGGTAFVLHRDGYLITTYHVVKEADSIVVENERFGRKRAEVIHVDPRLDLAILKVSEKKGFGPLPYGFTSASKRMGDRVFTLGYSREEPVYGEGYISSKSGYEGDSTSYQITLPLNPGNSGGPLFDQKGNVVGIVSGKHTIAEGAGFAIKTNFLKDLLPSISHQDKPIVLSAYSSASIASRSQQIDKVEGFVFKVIVY